MGTTTTSPARKVPLIAPFILSMVFPGQENQEKSMAGAATMTGTAAASPGS